MNVEIEVNIEKYKNIKKSFKEIINSLIKKEEFFIQVAKSKIKEVLKRELPDSKRMIIEHSIESLQDSITQYTSEEEASYIKDTINSYKEVLAQNNLSPEVQEEIKEIEASIIEHEYNIDKILKYAKRQPE